MRQTVALETGGGWGGTCTETPCCLDPVKFQGGDACLIEKSLLYFLLRWLRCIYSSKSQLPSLLGYFRSAFRPAGIQLQPSMVA